MKRLIVILLCIATLLCSCDAPLELEQENVIGAYAQKDEQQKKEKPLTAVTMLYYPDMDTNPVTTTCLANHELLKYVYSPLITVNASFDPVCVLAKSYTVSGKTITVKLRQGIVFSNGQKVSASDVVYTYNAVKKCISSPYYSSIQKMKKYYALDDTTFVCEFLSTDVDCANLLDIPIMYQGKAGVGCGAYVLSEQNGKPVLLKNSKYFEKASVQTINLVETKNDEYIDDMFSSGALDVMIPSGNDDMTLTSLRDYSILSCPSNRLIFIGVNFHNPVFSDINTRIAISTAIDRKSLTSKSLVDLATPTEHPFNPSWSKVSKIELTKRDADAVSAAAQKLKDLGLTLTVPVGGFKHTVAKELVENFKAAGITLTLRELDSASYTNAIMTGDYQLYLGEIAVSRNMDPTELYKTGGALNFCGYTDFNLDTAFTDYKLGKTTIAQYIDAFSQRMPIIPILYSKSVIYCAKGIKSFSGRSAFSAYGNGADLTI